MTFSNLTQDTNFPSYWIAPGNAGKAMGAHSCWRGGEHRLGLKMTPGKGGLSREGPRMVAKRTIWLC